MTKAKISEYDAVASNNTDVNGVNIAEGCPPSGMNNMGREIMAALKRFQVGSDGDGVTVGGNLVVSGSSTVNTFTAGPVSATTLNTSGAVVFNDAGADVDFRVEGDTDANLFFVDAGNDRVGIGTNTPATELDVAGTITSDGASLDGAVVINESGADVDFRVEGDTDANLLFVDAGNDRVGIGTSSPSGKLNLSDSTSCQLNINSSAAGATRQILFSASSNTQEALISANNSTGELKFESGRSGTTAYFQTFYTNNAERARITSDGIFQIGQSGAIFGQIINHTNSGTQRFINFEFDGNQIGAITGNNTNATYATSSDYRLKENIAPMTGALATVAQLQPCTWSWKSNGTNGQGFIAHELQEICPDAVVGEKDATRIEQYEVTPAVYENVVIPAVLDEDGNEVEPERTERQLVSEAVMGEREVPMYQGIDTSFLVATLTAAIQELSAKNDALEARIAALEGQ